jgi:protein phosphatase 1 regulatory subunit 7
MPVSQPQVRITNPATLPHAQINRDLKDGKHVIIQFVDKTYTNTMLEDINRLCAAYDKNFGVRFYGHYSSFFDCETVSRIPRVKCLYLDCLLKAENVAALNELEELQKLSLGVYELKETEILDFSRFKGIEDLIVTETKTKALNLQYLTDYKNLKSLILGGHSKNIEAVGALERLEFLSLNSVKQVSVSFVNQLKNLKTLHFILGGRNDISDIGSLSIEHLHIVRVQGLGDLGDIARFSKLKTLLIEDQIRLPGISFDGPMPALEDVTIINCKTLKSIQGMSHLTGLNRFRIYKTAVIFDEFVRQALPATLRAFAFYTGRKKTDNEIKEKIEKLGYSSSS